MLSTLLQSDLLMLALKRQHQPFPARLRHSGGVPQGVAAKLSVARMSIHMHISRLPKMYSCNHPMFQSF
jgi:hypothetical protein